MVKRVLVCLRGIASAVETEEVEPTSHKVSIASITTSKNRAVDDREVNWQEPVLQRNLPIFHV